MKTIGLIGGTSWKSSMEYYKLLNEMVNKRLGGYHSCKLVMYSVDFEYIQKYQHEGNWEAVSNILIEAASSLEKAGAELFIMCANTLHKAAEVVEGKVQIPLVHIADAAAKEVKLSNKSKVGLLGTKFTMEQNFYKDRLKSYNIETIVPSREEQILVHDIIFKELVFGKINEESRKVYLSIIASLIKKGAEGVILGCTEIPMLINGSNCSVPVFDTTYLHAKYVLEKAFENNDIKNCEIY